MVINPVIEIGNKCKPSLVATRPRPTAINVSSINIRQHEALMEARHRENAARADLQSAANALSASNSEIDRLSRMISELEAENAALKRENEALKKEEADVNAVGGEQQKSKRNKNRKNSSPKYPEPISEPKPVSDQA